MSAARPSHALALVPFNPDPVTGRDARAEAAIDAFCLANGKSYALSEPNLVTMNDGKTFLFIRGALEELILQQSSFQMDVTVKTQDRANGINQARERRVATVETAPAAGAQPRLMRP